MKKIILTIISLFLISFSLVSCTKGNDEVEVASLEYKDNGDGTSTVIGIGNYFSEDLVIPEKDNNGNIVTSIADEAFYCKVDDFLSSTYRIKSVKIADTVTYIGKFAFDGNRSIRKLELPQNDNLFIGEYAFSELAITQVVMPKNFYKVYKSKYSNKPRYFFGCNKLAEIYCQDESYSVVDEFFGVDSNTVIHKSLDEESIIDYFNPNYTTCKIDDKYYLLDYNIDDSYHKTYMTKDIMLPTYINYKGKIVESYGIYSGCFMYNSTISCVVIPNTVTEIGRRAFYWCNNLKYVNMQDSVGRIDDEAFYNCKSLYTISIPNSVTSLGKNMFYLCENLSYVYLDVSIEALPYKLFYECKIESLKIGDNIKIIEYCSIMCCEIKEIFLGNEVTHLNGYSMLECAGLESITIPKSVVSIYNPFHNCKDLKEIYYEGTVEEWNRIDLNLDNNMIKIICSDGEIEINN